MMSKASHTPGQNITPPMQRALSALAASEMGKLPYADFYQAMNVTVRGRYRVMSRMQDLGLVEFCQGGFQITDYARDTIAKATGEVA